MGKDGNAVEIGHFTIDYEGCLTCGCEGEKALGSILLWKGYNALS